MRTGTSTRIQKILPVVLCLLLLCYKAEGVTYYVSPSGNDANNGTSPGSAWKTIIKVNSSTFSPGDKIYFEGGQSFTGCLVFSYTTNIPISSATNPITVGSYGAGRATLISDCPGTNKSSTEGPRIPLVNINGVSGFTLENLMLSSGGTATQYGVLIQNGKNTTAEVITVQNCDISGFHVTGTSDFSGEIFIVGWAFNGSTAGLNKLFILHNTLHGTSGINSPDDNGISGYGYGKNIRNVLYQGNTIYHIGGHANTANGCSGNGIVANGVSKATMEYNVGHDLGANTNTCGGPAAFWAYNSDSIIIQYNEAYRVQPTATAPSGCDWNGFDLDGGVTNSVMQYNYSHDNHGAGYLLYADHTWGPNIVRYNISENDGKGIRDNTFGLIHFAGIKANPAVAYIYNNTVWNTVAGPASIRPVAFAISTWNNGLPPGGGYVANNIFAMGKNDLGITWFVTEVGSNPGQSQLQFMANNYYSINGGTFSAKYGTTTHTSLASWQTAVPGGDAGSTTANPDLSAPGTGGICSWTPAQGNGPQPCPAGYLLNSASPLTGTGLDLTKSPYNLDMGARDYYGISLPHYTGTGYNMGADNRDPQKPNAQFCQSALSPVIDGTEEGLWNLIKTDTLKNIILGSPASVAASHFTAHFKATWDTSALYLLVKVTDDTLANVSASNPWNGDAVEVFIDGNNDKTATYDTNDRQYIFRWNDTTVYQNQDAIPLASNPAGVSFKQGNHPGGYLMEIKISWSAPGVTAIKGKAVGLDIHADGHNVAYTGNRFAKLGWIAQTDQSSTRPSLFGIIRLDSVSCNNIPTGTGLSPGENRTLVYPNPFQSKVNLVIPGAIPLKNAMLRIYDLYGKEVRTVFLDGHTTELDRGELQNGVYFYTITSNNETLSNGRLMVID